MGPGAVSHTKVKFNEILKNMCFGVHASRKPPVWDSAVGTVPNVPWREPHGEAQSMRRVSVEEVLGCGLEFISPQRRMGEWVGVQINDAEDVG